jgi:hypothetical protein
MKNKTQNITNIVVALSLAGVFIGMRIDSWKFAIFSLVVYCTSSNIATVIALFTKVESIASSFDLGKIFDNEGKN